MAHPAGVLKHQRQPRPPGGRAMLSKQTAKLAGVPIAAHIPCRHAGIQQQRLLPVSAVSGLRLHAAATSGSSNCLPPMPSLQLQYHCRQHQQQPWRGAACCPPAAIAPPLEGLAALTAGPQWDYVCAALTAIVALAWVKLFDVLAGSGVLDQVRVSASFSVHDWEAAFHSGLPSCDGSSNLSALRTLLNPPHH